MNVLGADNKRCQSMREHDGARQTAGALTAGAGSGDWLIASFPSAVAASCSMWSQL
jgi:hypothetical protein